jgi:RNA polymerase sigma factor (sigma-70 family)
MPSAEWLAEQFEEHRPIFARGGVSDARVSERSRGCGQESWIRLGRTDVSGVENLRAWLTTVVARVSLDMLRTRASRREESLDVHVPDPVITRADGDPESNAMLADSVGLALLVVLETLQPAERLAFVLHDVFGMTFDEIAPIVDRSPAAARQLASRARRRVQRKAPNADADLHQQRRVVDAFLAAQREGDFGRLVALLEPDIVLRADGRALAGASRLIRGAQAVAALAAGFSKLGLSNQVAFVNGNVGVVARRPDGRLLSVLGFTIVSGKIVEIDILADPERLNRLDLSAIEN